MTKTAEKHSGACRIFWFSDWYLALSSLMAALLFGFAAFSAYVQDMENLALVFLAILLTITLLRLRFVVQSPKWIKVNIEDQELQVKRRWPAEGVWSISLSGLKSVEAKISVGKFPMVGVYFEYFEKKTQVLWVRPESTGRSFLSFPEDSVPSQIKELISSLNSEVLKRTFENRTNGCCRPRP